MNLDVKQFARKPFHVQAVQVTADNFDDVALWCNGTVIRESEGGGSSYVKVDVRRPLHDRQTQAYVGDWVLRAGQGFRVYNNTAFDKSFDEMAIVSSLEEFSSIQSQSSIGMAMGSLLPSQYAGVTVVDSGEQATTTVGTSYMMPTPGDLQRNALLAGTN